MKIKILYVVSNLRKTGPTRQLLYILKNLEHSKFEARVLTLSPEPVDSLARDYVDSNVRVDTLGITNFLSYLSARQKFERFLDNFHPDLLQTQGLRSDALASNCSRRNVWITTSRNYPFEDYPSEYGLIKGNLMAYKHLNILRECRHLVSCSTYIQSRLKSTNIESVVIKNGVESSTHVRKRQREVKNFVTAGGLIERKNITFLVELFKYLYIMDKPYQLVILGDGPLRKELRELSTPNVAFLGDIENVLQNFEEADAFISSSRSEGLPNAVLEAVSSGLPVVLSDIPSHVEITAQLPWNAYELFSLDTSPSEVASNFDEIVTKLNSANGGDIASVAFEVFSAQNMSQRYQLLYEEIALLA